jgi:hypothetical protein
MSEVQQIIVGKTLRYLDHAVNSAIGDNPLLVVPTDFIKYRPPKDNVIKIKLVGTFE